MAGSSITTTVEEPMTEPSAQEGESTHPLAEAGQQATESAGHLASRAVDLDSSRPTEAASRQPTASSMSPRAFAA